MTESRFCSECGSVVRPGLSFCERCGAPRGGGSGKFRYLALFIVVLVVGIAAWVAFPRPNHGPLSTPLAEVEPTAPARSTENSTPAEPPLSPKSGSLDPRNDSRESSKIEDEIGDWHTKEVRVDSKTNSPFSNYKGDDEHDSLPGIEEADLSNPDTYLPYPRTLYEYYAYYPDGDEGSITKFVVVNEASQTLVLEKAESKLYPEDGPTETRSYFKNWGEGVYRAVDSYSSDYELYLPNDLFKGKTWAGAGGQYTIVEFDRTVKVGGRTYQGALGIEHTSPAVGLKETIWLAPGHGELMVRDRDSGRVTLRLLSTESLSEKELQEILRKL